MKKPIFLIIFFISLFVCQLSASDSLSYKIGQMVMTGFIPGSDFEDTLYYDLEHRNLGGVILMGYNLENPSQISTLTSSLQAHASTPLLIATDQEGGVVARLDERNGFESTSYPIELGNLNRESVTRAQAALMAGWFNETGLNTNLAPVADVDVNPNSPAIGSYGRSFSNDPEIVSNHCYWFYSEFERRDIISALKHFPGHGSATGDSHDGFTDVTDTWTAMELIPFKTLIDTGYSDMIMTAHLYNANIDTNYPATLSKPTLTGILRDSLGFDGVIITDDMRMRAISDIYGFSESVIRAIDAGVDILLYVGNEKFGSSVLKQINRVVTSAIDSGLISENRIDESYDRIVNLKTKTNTAITPLPLIANTFDLHAYPNPFNPATTLSFRINEMVFEMAELSIFSINGRLMRRFTLDISGMGNYTVTWDAKDRFGREVPSGTYIIGLQLNNKLYAGKITLIK